MRNSWDKNRILDSLGIIAIGVVSLGYVLFIRSFAELHVQFPFLDFPIFIGEGLLFFCLGLMLCKGNVKITAKNFWIFVYMGFVLIKAVTGYIKFGPLALRHAALFYYPLFAVFGYSLYHREFFDRRKSLFFILLILLLFAQGTFDSYWVFTFILLAFILIWTYPQRIFRYVLLATLALVAPYKFLFCTSRMMIAANFVTGIWLAVGLYFMLRTNKAIKLTVVVLGVLLISFGLVRFSDKNALATIVKVDKIIETFRNYDMEVAAQIEKERRVAQEKAHLRSVQNTQDTEDQKAEKLQVYNPDPSLYFSVREKSRSAAPSTSADTTSAQVARVKVSVERHKEEGSAKQEEIAGPTTVLQLASAQEKVKGEPAVPAATAQSVAVSVTEAPATTLPPEDTPVKNKISAKRTKSEKSAQEQVERSVKTVISKQDRSVDAAVPVKIEPKPEEIARDNVQIYNPDPPFNFHFLGKTKSTDDGQRVAEKSNGMMSAVEHKPPQLRNLEGAYINAVFRLFIWRDMRDEWLAAPVYKRVLGFHFGKPLRPKSLKALNWATLELFREGWVEPHNSYLHIIYRTGVIGLVVVVIIFVFLGKMIKASIQYRSLVGILLCGILVNWLVAANFLLILELPYTAVPVWTLFGLTYAYVERLTTRSTKTVEAKIK